MTFALYIGLCAQQQQQQTVVSVTIKRKLMRTVAMRGIEFMLFLSLTGTISCTQSVLNSTWWPCASLSPYQELQLEQVMLFIYCTYVITSILIGYIYSSFL
jgi:hypothetical protein